MSTDAGSPFHLSLPFSDHSDPTGLYSYRNQPNRVLFALDSLASALLPELGYEAKNGRAPTEGWGAEATADDVRMWEEAGLEAIKGWNDVFNDTVEKTQREASMKVSQLTLCD